MFFIMQFSKEELENEIWLDIPDFEGLYQVSDLGRVKSLDRNVESSGRNKFCKGSILKLQKSGRYLKIELYKNGEYKRYSIHRLVMFAFEGHSDLVVDHEDENGLNNRKTNLRYLTHRDNVSRGFKNKTSKYTGVSWDESKGKWRAYLRINNVGYSLGCFTSELKAHLTYEKCLADYLNLGISPQKIKRGKEVLNEENGVFHNSVKEAAIVYGICNKYLSLMLNGKRHNKTSLVFV